MPSLRRAIMPLCPFLPRAECRFPYLVWPVCCWGQERTWPHAAIRIMADSGCMVIWCGEGVGRFYASSLGETRSSANVLAQAKACIPSSMDWASRFSPFCHLMSCPKSLYHIPLEHTGLQIEIFYRFGFGKQPCPQRVLHHIGHNIVWEQLFPNMPDNICLANMAGAIYQENLRGMRLQVLLNDFLISPIM